MMNEDLDSRKQQILLAVVQQHILTGKPVGSRTVAEGYDIGVSAATIRSEMSALENEGYLRQPYTSAGRIPTDAAYRHYVNMLMEHPQPAEIDNAAVQKLFAAKSREIEEMLRESSLLLSRLTRTAAMVFAPYVHSERILHVELVHLNDLRTMLVPITAKGEVGRRLLNLEQRTSAEAVEDASSYLNQALAGKSADGIRKSELVGGAPLDSAGKVLVEAAIDGVLEYLGAIEERVFIRGAANIVREMGYVDTSRVEALLDSLDRQYLIIDLLKELISLRDLTVRIGEENQEWELQKCTFVGTSYPVAPGLRGSLGVLGPTCMDYAHTIGMVEYIAENLGKVLMGPQF